MYRCILVVRVFGRRQTKPHSNKLSAYFQDVRFADGSNSNPQETKYTFPVTYHCREELASAIAASFTGICTDIEVILHGRGRSDGRYLVELGYEVGGTRSAAADLPQREGDEDGCEVVGDGVIQVSVHQMPPPPLYQVHNGRPCP